MASLQSRASFGAPTAPAHVRVSAPKCLNVDPSRSHAMCGQRPPRRISGQTAHGCTCSRSMQDTDGAACTAPDMQNCRTSGCRVYEQEDDALPLREEGEVGRVGEGGRAANKAQEPRLGGARVGG